MQAKVHPWNHVNLTIRNKMKDEEGSAFFTSHNQEIIDFYKSIHSIHFLDCHRFIAVRKIISCFQDFISKHNPNLVVFLHQTPTLFFNSENIYRKHVAEECMIFHTLMKECGVRGFLYFYSRDHKTGKVILQIDKGAKDHTGHDPNFNSFGFHFEIVKFFVPTQI